MDTPVCFTVQVYLQYVAIIRNIKFNLNCCWTLNSMFNFKVKNELNFSIPSSDAGPKSRRPVGLDLLFKYPKCPTLSFSLVSIWKTERRLDRTRHCVAINIFYSIKHNNQQVVSSMITRCPANYNNNNNTYSSTLTIYSVINMYIYNGISVFYTKFIGVSYEPQVVMYLFLNINIT